MGLDEQGFEARDPARGVDSATRDDLSLAAGGDLEALSRVMPMVYDRVREIAGNMLAGDRAKRWVQASSLVQRAFLRLMDQRNVDLADEARVTAVLATIMRRIVVDIARQETAIKRGGGISHVSLHAEQGLARDGSPPARVDALEVEDALVALAAVSPDAARVAELRLWGGMDLSRIAIATSLPEQRVRTLWHAAKAWLARDLSRDGVADA